MAEGDFAGKVALVTGAASGIGRASARAFAARGAKVVVADVDGKGGEETVRQIADEGGVAVYCEADVSQAASVEGLIAKAVSEYGRLDCAHNNAGVLGKFAPTADSTEENWERIVSINLKGVWLCLRAELRQMLEQGSGSVVNTSSAAGLVGMPGLSAYVASKHGVAGLTKAAAIEYADTGIRVNAVCPGFIDTPMVAPFGGAEPPRRSLVPAARLGSPEEVAEAVVWLCSDASSYVTGHLLSVDGAMVTQ